MRLTPMKRRAIRQLVLLDYIAISLAWFTLWMYRQHVITNLPYLDTLKAFRTHDLLNTLIFVPAGWLFAYLMTGTYFDLYRKSRLNEINRTLISCIIGCVFVSTIAFAKDSGIYSFFIDEFSHYLLIHSVYTLVFRLGMLYHIKRNLKKGVVGFKTLIIGGNQQAINIYKQVLDSPKVLGNIFIGFIYSSKEASNGMTKYLPQLGHLSQLEEIIDENGIEEVIVAVDSSEHHLLEDIVTRL